MIISKIKTLNCDTNNSSRACPIMLCNLKFDKHPVDRVVKNLGNKKVLDYRVSTKNCSNQYVGGESNKDLKSVNLKDSTYFKGIDNENDLLSIVNKIGCNRTFTPKCLSTGTNSTSINLASVNEYHQLSDVDSKLDRYPQYIRNCINFENKDYCPMDFQLIVEIQYQIIK